VFGGIMIEQKQYDVICKAFELACNALAKSHFEITDENINMVEHKMYGTLKGYFLGKALEELDESQKHNEVYNTMSFYTDKGYNNRRDYLQQLADEYDVPFDLVVSLAQLLGATEDFDGLINALEDAETYLEQQDE
jgi:hypothetical protein